MEPLPAMHGARNSQPVSQHLPRGPETCHKKQAGSGHGAELHAEAPLAAHKSTSRTKGKGFRQTRASPGRAHRRQRELAMERATWVRPSTGQCPYRWGSQGQATILSLQEPSHLCPHSPPWEPEAPGGAVLALATEPPRSSAPTDTANFLTTPGGPSPSGRL